jgi:hypothetical protein
MRLQPPSGFKVIKNPIKDGKCPCCNKPVPGKWSQAFICKFYGIKFANKRRHADAAAPYARCLSAVRACL